MSAVVEHNAPEVQPYRTGLNPNLMGLIIFLVSELALFGAFFMYYGHMRFIGRVDYPGAFHIPANETSINTLILVVSSFTAEFALLALLRRHNAGVFFSLLATFILGSIFLGLQVHEYMIIGFTPQDTAVGSIFFALTGLHGLHVFVGLVLLLLAMVRTCTHKWTPESHTGLLGISVYWHFVDIVWVILFTVVYCLPGNVTGHG